ncbi:eukaryotic translation initiation factor 5A-1-like [Ptychodera flava]|uniref:eukaryotic translation initiation factor 5A-1-like n=1 Tax=Ptychodera flava TaxID=63121 RepID=UPI003969D3D8
MSDDEFIGADAGASDTFPVRCSALRKGGYVMLNDRPCKIVELSTARPGKHGHAKVRIVGRDLFTQRRYEGISPSTHNINVPYVRKQDFQVLGVGDRFLSLLDDRGQIHDGVEVPEGEIGERVREKFNNEDDFMVTVLTVKDEGIVSGVKETASGN